MFHNLAPIGVKRYRTFGNERHFSLSAARQNENTKLQEAILLSDSCVERIKEIADDKGYLRVMVGNSSYNNFLLSKM